MGHNVVFPAGNARLQDRVLLVTAKFTKADKLCGPIQFNPRKPTDSRGLTVLVGRVAQVGLLNKHGWPLDIRIRWANGARGAATQLPPNFADAVPGSSGCVLRRQLLILPPQRELPFSVRRFARMQGLVPVRTVRNVEFPRYSLVCGKCLGSVDYLCDYLEAAALTFRSGNCPAGWYQGQPDIVGGDGERLECAWCHTEYPVPDELKDDS
jgi:hypothetical protein